MGHETYFTEDFLSDEDDIPLLCDYACDNNVLFMPGPYEDMANELKIYSKEEIGSQCENKNPASLSYLSSLPAYSVCLKDKVLIPNLVQYSLAHTPRVSLPEKIEEKYLCKFCYQKFRTGQALGGHISRKH